MLACAHVHVMCTPRVRACEALLTPSRAALWRKRRSASFWLLSLSRLHCQAIGTAITQAHELKQRRNLVSIRADVVHLQVGPSPEVSGEESTAHSMPKVPLHPKLHTGTHLRHLLIKVFAQMPFFSISAHNLENLLPFRLSRSGCSLHLWFAPHVFASLHSRAFSCLP